MPNANITRMAYAASLKELMQEKSYDKITVAQICSHYGLTRKSFYYHFRDKNDLVAWIFDQDCEKIVAEQRDHPEEFVSALCSYLYANKAFYEKLLNSTEENSFSRHFEEYLYPLVQNWLKTIFDQENIPSMYIEFVTDGFVCTVKRWLRMQDGLSAQEFILALRHIINKIADSLNS